MMKTTFKANIFIINVIIVFINNELFSYLIFLDIYNINCKRNLFVMSMEFIIEYNYKMGSVNFTITDTFYCLVVNLTYPPSLVGSAFNFFSEKKSVKKKLLKKKWNF